MKLDIRTLLLILLVIISILFVFATLDAKVDRFYYGRLVELEGLTNCIVEYDSVRKLVLADKNNQYKFWINSSRWVVFYKNGIPVRLYTVVGREWQVLNVLHKINYRR